MHTQTITGTGKGGERHTKSQKVPHYEMPELKLPQSKVSTKYTQRCPQHSLVKLEPTFQIGTCHLSCKTTTNSTKHLTLEHICRLEQGISSNRDVCQGKFIEICIETPLSLALTVPPFQLDSWNALSFKYSLLEQNKVTLVAHLSQNEN